MHGTPISQLHGTQMWPAFPLHELHETFLRSMQSHKTLLHFTEHDLPFAWLFSIFVLPFPCFSATARLFFFFFWYFSSRETNFRASIRLFPVSIPSSFYPRRHCKMLIKHVCCGRLLTLKWSLYYLPAVKPSRLSIPNVMQIARYYITFLLFEINNIFFFPFYATKYKRFLILFGHELS